MKGEEDRPITGMGAEEVRFKVDQRQDLQRREIEDYLLRSAFAYSERRDQLWARDYTSVQAYVKSVEPNRRRLAEALGVFDAEGSDFAAEWRPFFEDDKITARRLRLQAAPGLFARAVLALPAKGAAPFPLVVCQHGIASSPERVFGFDDPPNVYKGYGRALAERGFAVLAPSNTTGHEPRNRLERIAKLLGKTLWGLEVFKIRRLLDFLETLGEVDVGRAGMYGISLGGAYTSFLAPLEPRIKAAVICAWFNDRLAKMLVEDPRYSCFLPSPEEYVFLPGWLREFADSDLASLICPRPLLVECGKGDGIAWWPLVVAEFNRTREHWDKLGLGDRCEIDLHDGGHEIRGVRSFEFLEKWLVKRAD
jgi:dipeptidyl aminopeptidase/acylaminoacyl peptidase